MATSNQIHQKMATSNQIDQKMATSKITLELSVFCVAAGLPSYSGCDDSWKLKAAHLAFTTLYLDSLDLLCPFWIQSLFHSSLFHIFKFCQISPDSPVVLQFNFFKKFFMNANPTSMCKFHQNPLESSFSKRKTILTSSSQPLPQALLPVLHTLPPQRRSIQCLSLSCIGAAPHSLPSYRQ